MVQVYVPKATDWIGAFEAGQQGAMTRRKEEGARQIGGLMASGDYKGASAAAFGTGEYATGAQLEKIGSDRDATTRRQTYATKLSTGGRADEIAKEALAAGDLDFYKELDGIADKQKLDKAKAFGGILRAIGSEPEDAWDDLILANRGQLEALDISPAEIDFFAQSDPAQRRVLMSTMLSRADMLDKYLDDRRQDTKPDWKEIKNADGSSYYQDFNDRNGGAQTQSQPVTQNAGGAIDPQHLDAIVRTVWGEARNEVPEGQSAVASVILNRARSTGKTPAEIVREQNQFEPWGNPKTRADLEALDPNSEAYQSILRNIAPALSGQDVTGGADHFYSPTAQSALGRKPPSWDNGKGRDLGRHRFFSLGYGGGSPQAAPRMAAAAPQPTAEPVLAGGPGNDAIQPYEVASIGATPAPPSGPRTRQGSAAPRPEWQDLPGGGQVNIRTGEKKNLPGLDSGPVLDPATGLTPIGDPRQGIYRNALGQKYQTNRSGTVQRLAGPTDTQVGETEKRIMAINETMALVDAVDEQLAKTSTLGPGGRYIVNQAEFARLDSLTKQLQIAYKNAAELGAITGPDVPFIEAVAPNPRELRSLIQRGEFAPRLQSLAKVAGTKYRGQTAAFKALGGDATGLTPLYRSPRSKVPYDNEGRVTAPAAQAKRMRFDAQGNIIP